MLARAFFRLAKGQVAGSRKAGQFRDDGWKFARNNPDQAPGFALTHYNQGAIHETREQTGYMCAPVAAPITLAGMAVELKLTMQELNHEFN